MDKICLVMGDSRRFIVTAEFIARNFPRIKTVLCVADGKGHLAALLNKAGYNATIIDPAYKGSQKRLKGLFYRDTDVQEYDLLVGLHPDEATAEIIHAAKNSSKHALIVPCCKLGPDATKAGDWWKYLVNISPVSRRIHQMKFNGMNKAIYF